MKLHGQFQRQFFLSELFQAVKLTNLSILSERMPQIDFGQKLESTAQHVLLSINLKVVMVVFLRQTSASADKQTRLQHWPTER